MDVRLEETRLKGGRRVRTLFVKNCLGLFQISHLGGCQHRDSWIYFFFCHYIMLLLREKISGYSLFFLSYLLFFFFGITSWHVGGILSQFPNQGINPCHLQWEHSVLTTALPDKFQLFFLYSTAHSIGDTQQILKQYIYFQILLKTEQKTKKIMLNCATSQCTSSS